MAPFHLFLARILPFILRRHASAPGCQNATFVIPVATVLLSVAGTDPWPARGEEPPGGTEAAGLYRRYCQRCHGTDGTGQRGAGAEDVPNFTRRAWQQQRDDAELLVSILDGKGTVMPAFQDRLSEAHVKGLVAYIRAFAPAPPTTAAAKSSSSDRVPATGFAGEFRQLQGEFDELQRQLQELDSTRQRSAKPPPRTESKEGGPKTKRSEKAPDTPKQTSVDEKQAPQEPKGLAARVRPLFSEKCAQCHGADLRRPKGKFGYVLDLERVRGNHTMVVAFRPDKSKLWKLIRDDKMPPEDSSVEPLTTEEKGLVRDWIAAGAPAAQTRSSSADGDRPSSAEAPSPPPAVAPPSLHHLLCWLGRFHIPVIHFPIALFLAAAAGDLWCLWWRISDPWPPIRFCVLLGAAGSVAAAALGWLHADFGGYGADSPALLGPHRWLGTLGSCSAAIAAVVSEIDSRRRQRSLLFHLVLFPAALLIGAAGHFGGGLVHGDDFFAW
jgi:mono/diheme cytochrome c family protein